MKLLNRFFVILRTRPFKVVGFEDIIVLLTHRFIPLFKVSLRRNNQLKDKSITKNKERVEKKYPLSISNKKSDFRCQ
jgi:hypothetical protein